MAQQQQEEEEALFPVLIYIDIKIKYLACFHESASEVFVGTKNIYSQNILYVNLDDMRSPDLSRSCISCMIRGMVNDHPVILEHVGNDLELLSEKVSSSICEQAEAIGVGTGSDNSGVMLQGIEIFAEKTVEENEIPLVLNEMIMYVGRASILGIPSLNPQIMSASNSEICSICLCDYSKGDVVCHLPCSHLFHCTCMIKWHVRSNSCPLCRCTI